MALLYTALFQVCFNLALLPGEGENLAKERIHGMIVQRRLPRASQLNFGKQSVSWWGKNGRLGLSIKHINNKCFL